MNWWIFVLLTVMHPVADFFTWHRGWGKNWKTRFVSEYVLALNPLHALWDMFSPWRRHPKYIELIKKDYQHQNASWIRDDDEYTYTLHVSVLKEEGWDVMNVNWLFWRWLGVDQLAHVLLNLFVAWLVGVWF